MLLKESYWRHEINLHQFGYSCGRTADILLIRRQTAYCSLRNEMGRNEMEICSLRNGNLYFAKWKSVLCEMRICSLRTTDFHFANYRFPFRKLQIPISQTTDFHFHFVSQTTVIKPGQTTKSLPWVPEVLFFFREERAVKTERRKINLWSRRL